MQAYPNVFEINKNNSNSGGNGQSFTNEMMYKYGMASREMHGWLQLTFVMGK